MEVDEKKAGKTEHNGKTYYFCGPTCQWAFKENPELFIQKES
jgi:YHS domain-containing protein